MSEQNESDDEGTSDDAESDEGERHDEGGEERDDDHEDSKASDHAGAGDDGESSDEDKDGDGDEDSDDDDKNGDGDKQDDDEQDGDQQDGDEEQPEDKASEEQESDESDADEDDGDQDDGDQDDGDNDGDEDGDGDDAQEEEDAGDDERGGGRRVAVTESSGRGERAATTRAGAARKPFPEARSFPNPLTPADAAAHEKLAAAMTDLIKTTKTDTKYDRTTVVIANVKTGKFVGLKERDFRFPASVGKLCAIYGLFALRDALNTYAKDAAGTMSQAEFFASVLKRAEQRVANDSPLRDTVFNSLDKTSASKILGAMYDSSYTHGELGQYFELRPAGAAGSQRIGFTPDVEKRIGSFSDGNSGSRSNLAVSATGYAYIAHALLRAGLMELSPFGGLWFATVFGAEQAENVAPPPWKIAHVAAPAGGGSNQATALHMARLWTLVAQQAKKDDAAGASASASDPTHPIRAMRLKGLNGGFMFDSEVQLGKVGDADLKDGYSTFSEVTWIKVDGDDYVVCYLDVRASGLGTPVGNVFWTNYARRIEPFRDKILELIRDNVVG